MKNESSQDPLTVLGRAKGYSKQEIIQTLPRHSQFNPQILQKIKEAPDVVFRNLGKLFARKIIKMMREISREAYRAKQFTRTEINDRGVLYGVVLLKHRVIDLVLNYFHARWPECIICLYNEHTQHTWTIDEKGGMKKFQLDLEEIVDQISVKRDSKPYFEDIQFSGEEIFETLYKSQNIEERVNSRYFQGMIPKKCFKLPGMKKGVEKRFTPNNKKIDEFF